MRDDGAVRDAKRSPADLPARAQGAPLVLERPALALPALASGEPGESREDYLALFEGARADQLAGEGSTAYIWSRTAAGLIAEAQPKARIIVIIREPASYLRSLHLQLLQHKSEEVESLREALALEPERRQGRHLTAVNADWPQVLFYSDRVRYVEQLRRYQAVFDPEQILVLIYDDFRADNDATVRRVERFLGVEQRGAGAPAEANTSVRRRVRVDNALHEAFFGGGGAMRTGPPRGPPRDSGAGPPQGLQGAAPEAGLRESRRGRRGVDARAAPALQGRGRGSERVPGPRPDGPVGLSGPRMSRAEARLGEGAQPAEKISSVPLCEWSLPLPSGSTTWPSTTIGLFQWPGRPGSLAIGCGEPGR